MADFTDVIFVSNPETIVDKTEYDDVIAVDVPVSVIVSSQDVTFDVVDVLPIVYPVAASTYTGFGGVTKRKIVWYGF